MSTTTFRIMRNSISLAALVTPVLFSTFTTTAHAAGASGSCVSARIDASFQLPDGSVHDAGTLMMCEATPFSPVASVHRMYVNGRPVGMFVSKNLRGESEETARPSVVLQRVGDGPFELLGYVRPGQGRNVSYQFKIGRYASPVPSALTGTGGPLAVVAAAK